MSGNRDCQETSPDRGPPAAVEPRQSIYGMHNAGDGHMPGPTKRIDGQGTDGRGSLYGRSSASRPWDDGNDAEYIPGPSLSSPPGTSTSFRFPVNPSLTFFQASRVLFHTTTSRDLTLPSQIHPATFPTTRRQQLSTLEEVPIHPPRSKHPPPSTMASPRHPTTNSHLCKSELRKTARHHVIT